MCPPAGRGHATIMMGLVLSWWSAACSPAREPSSPAPEGSLAARDAPLPHTVGADAHIPGLPSGVAAPATPAGDPVAARASDGGATPSAPTALPPEEKERDPRSAEVTIRLLVEPPNRAHVFWGVKDLGPAPLELRRPRGSGPLDLVVRAPGYLTFHTRVFTDRDDRLSIRMVPVTEAATVFGFRPEARAR